MTFTLGEMPVGRAMETLDGLARVAEAEGVIPNSRFPIPSSPDSRFPIPDSR